MAPPTAEHHQLSLTPVSAPVPHFRTLAIRCLAAKPRKLPALFRDAVEPMLKTSWQLSLPRASEDEALAQRVLSGLVDKEMDLRHLLAAMLLLFPFELPRITLEDMPGWLLPTFLKYLHRAPQFFPTVEAHQAHVAFLCEWTRQVAAHLTVTETCWQAAAQAYAGTSNLIPAYFTDENLIELYASRGRILGHVLRTNGFSLDHTFTSWPKAGKLRIGFLNATWGPKTETFATLPLFEFLNRDRFEIILLSPSTTNTEVDAYCRSIVDRVVPLQGNLPAQAQTIRGCDLNLLFFGTNLTAVNHSMVVLAMHRLAPIQITSICSPVTTGMPTIDYFLAGTLTEPKRDAQTEYTEKLVLLEGSGICFNYAMRPPATGLTISRTSLNIPEQAPLLVSGSNFFKLGPQVRQAWAEILAASPETYLVLYPFGPAWSSTYPHQIFLDDMHDRFCTLGVQANRLVLMRPFANSSDVTNLLRLADLYLDSFPYSGATSLLDPLLADLPPITMTGNRLRFAQGDAILQELGLEELIVRDITAYVDMAVSLIRDTPHRQALRARIRQKMLALPPFLDRHAFALKAAAAFERMVAEGGYLGGMG